MQETQINADSVLHQDAVTRFLACLSQPTHQPKMPLQRLFPFDLLQLGLTACRGACRRFVKAACPLAILNFFLLVPKAVLGAACYQPQHVAATLLEICILINCLIAGSSRPLPPLTPSLQMLMSFDDPASGMLACRIASKTTLRI